MATVLAAQELTVKSWQVWENEDGPIRDPHGNYKGNVTFNEYSAQPVDATFKNQPEVGEKKYGSIEEYQTKAGKTRIKFQRQDRPEAQTSTGSKESGSSWQPRDDEAIRAQWAIGQAVQFYIADLKKSETKTAKEVVENLAKDFYAMVNRVKGSDQMPDVPQMSAEEWASFQQDNHE